jgi:alanine racemase
MLSWDRTSNIAHWRCESPLDMLRERAWVEIDRGAIAHNVRQIRGAIASETALMAVVKADAYGHGAISVAQSALDAGANWLGVATIPEGIELREAGITAPILVLGATYTPAQLRALVHWQLQATLCMPKQALVFSETLAELGQSLPVHLKIDTGMSRLGVLWREAAEFVQLVRRLPYLEIASVYSHLATADDRDPREMQRQHQRFQEAIARIRATGFAPPRLHLANSAATLRDRALHYDMVRVGLAIYGLYPAKHLQGTVQLQPAMQVKARVTQVKTIEAGSGISYGYQFVAPRDMRVAVVGIGYADGVPRPLSNGMDVLLRDRRVPQVGAITMDQLMLDVSQVPDVQPGEVVTLLGKQGGHCILADDWAAQLGTISWEILCGFKHRLPRVSIE